VLSGVKLGAWPSHAKTLTELYLTYGLLGGIGTGIVYIGVVSQMVKWFPERRGFAVGMVAAGYWDGRDAHDLSDFSEHRERGLSIDAVDVRTDFRGGRPAGLAGPEAALRMNRKRSDQGNLETTGRRRTQSDAQDPGVSWLLFAMMTMLSTSGLMVISQTAAFARDFGVASAVVWGFAAVPAALFIRSHHELALYGLHRRPVLRLAVGSNRTRATRCSSPSCSRGWR